MKVDQKLGREDKVDLEEILIGISWRQNNK